MLKVFTTLNTLRLYCITFRFTGRVEKLLYHHILIAKVTAAWQSDHVKLPEIKHAIHSCDQNDRKRLHLTQYSF